MYQPCSSEKAALQQRKFEECMIDLMLERHYDSISVSELCRYAGMSRKTFYRLFETKADVIYAMVDHRIIDEAAYIPEEGMKDGGLHRFFGYWRTQKKFLDALSLNHCSNLLSQRAIIYTMREAPDCRHMFGSDSEENSWESMIFYLSGLFALVLDWHERGFSRNIDELCALCMQLLTTPPIKNPWLLDPNR